MQNEVKRHGRMKLDARTIDKETESTLNDTHFSTVFSPCLYYNVLLVHKHEDFSFGGACFYCAVLKGLARPNDVPQDHNGISSDLFAC